MSTIILAIGFVAVFAGVRMVMEGLWKLHVESVRTRQTELRRLLHLEADK